MDEVAVIQLRDSPFKLKVFHSQGLLRLTETRTRPGPWRTGEVYDHMLSEATVELRRGMRIECIQEKCCDECGPKVKVRVDGRTVMRWPARLHV